MQKEKINKMDIKKIIFKLLPVETFIVLRGHYRNFQKAIHKPLTEKEFKNLLSNQFKIKPGAVLFIHSSVGSLNIEFSVIRMFNILKEMVGEEGTLVFPAWHFTYRAEEYLRKNLIFDVKRSPSALGLLSEIARRHPDAKRSVHPLNSIVAIGKNAIDIVEEHGDSIYPCDEKSPYYKIMKYNGIIMGLGVNTDFLSFVHCPEDVMKGQFPVKTRLDEVFESRVRLINGTTRIIKTLTAHPQIKHRDINNFLKRYVGKEICRNFTLKGNRFFVAHSKELFDEIVLLAKKGKTIYTDKAVYSE